MLKRVSKADPAVKQLINAMSQLHLFPHQRNAMAQVQPLPPHHRREATQLHARWKELGGWRGTRVQIIESPVDANYRIVEYFGDKNADYFELSLHDNTAARVLHDASDMREIRRAVKTLGRIAYDRACDDRRLDVLDDGRKT